MNNGVLATIGPRLKKALRPLAWPAASIILALAIGALLIWVSGRNPAQAYQALLQGAFGNKYAITETLIKVVPLLLCGLGLAFAFNCSFFNMGAEGQFYIGALAATWIGVSLNGPKLVMIPLMLLGSFVAGGFLCSIAAWLKVKLRLTEIINTIMLNYVAIGLSSWAVNGPLQETQRFLPQSNEMPAGAALPIIWPGTRLHAGFLIAIAAAIVLYFILYKTVLGYQTRAVGWSPRAAAYAGMNTGRRMLQASLIGGGLAGMAGSIELMGVTHRLYQVFSPGYGWDAIAVALLARQNPLACIASAFLFAVLRAGAGQMQRAAGVSSVLIYMIQALVIIFLVLATMVPKFAKASRPEAVAKEVA